MCCLVSVNLFSLSAKDSNPIVSQIQCTQWIKRGVNMLPMLPLVDDDDDDDYVFILRTAKHTLTS